jgi:predicted homoserine dehydrogenase-like protein
MGLSEGCVLKRDLPIDAPVTLADVEVPSGRLSDRLFAEQNQLFRVSAGGVCCGDTCGNGKLNREPVLSAR